jgi:hypothetical protein
MSVVATSTAVPVPVSLRGVSDVIPLLCDALVATLTGPDRIETVTGIPEEEEGKFVMVNVFVVKTICGIWGKAILWVPGVEGATTKEALVVRPLVSVAPTVMVTSDVGELVGYASNFTFSLLPSNLVENEEGSEE